MDATKSASNYRCAAYNEISSSLRSKNRAECRTLPASTVCTGRDRNLRMVVELLMGRPGGRGAVSVITTFRSQSYVVGPACLQLVRKKIDRLSIFWAVPDVP